DRHDPGLYRPEKGGRKGDRVMQAHQDALFRMDPEPAQDIGEPARPIGKLGIAVTAAIVDEGRLWAASGREGLLDQIGSGVVCRDTLHPRSSSLSVLPAAGHIIFAGCSRRRSIS